MCRSESWTFARLGSFSLAWLDDCPDLAIKRMTAITTAKKAAPAAIGAQLLRLSCAGSGENGCWSESPMPEFYYFFVASLQTACAVGLSKVLSAPAIASSARKSASLEYSKLTLQQSSCRQSAAWDMRWNCGTQDHCQSQRCCSACLSGFRRQ